MRSRERWEKLIQSPKMLWNLLFRARYDYSFDLMPIHLKQMSVAKRINFMKACLNFIYRRTNPWSWPVHMHIELTNYCNLRCPVCYVGNSELKRKPLAMDPVLFERLIDEVGPYLLTVSLFAWGEPLLHPQLADILRIADKHCMATILSTNGQNLDDESVLNALINHPPTYLIVSIDGVTNETNRLFRVGSKLEPVLAGVRRIAAMKRQKGLNLPLLHMRYIVMKHNQHELSYIQKFAIENQFDLLTVRTLSICGNDRGGIHRKLVPDEEQFKAYKYEGNKRVHLKDFVCQHAFSFPTILADGTVVACCQDYNAQQPYGKVTHGCSFRDVWFSKRAATIRKTVRNARNNLSFCKNCSYADRPVSTCSILAFDLQGQKNCTIPIPRS